jgi:hypothetical protein
VLGGKPETEKSVPANTNTTVIASNNKKEYSQYRCANKYLGIRKK